jgi:hypothetical protein
MNPSANISNSARKYVETRDEKKIVEELYELAPCAVVKMVALAITLAPMY